VAALAQPIGCNGLPPSGFTESSSSPVCEMRMKGRKFGRTMAKFFLPLSITRIADDYEYPANSPIFNKAFQHDSGLNGR
jgi:hypothetical protein